MRYRIHTGDDNIMTHLCPTCDIMAGVIVMHPSAALRAAQNVGSGANVGGRWTDGEMGAMAGSGEQEKQGSATPTQVLRVGGGFVMGH